MADEQPSETLLLENRALRDKMMRIQNLFTQLLIACYSDPNSIGSVLGEMHQTLNDTVALSQSTIGAGTSGSGAHQPSQPISPESATALFSLPQMVATTTPAMSNLQMLIAEMTSAAGGSGVLSDVPASSLTGNANNMNRVPVPPTASEALQDVPAKPFLDYLSSIDEIWREYRYGDPQSARPSIIELDSKYGDKWRKKEYVADLKELKSRQNLYNKRKCVWSEVQRFMDTEGLSEEAAVECLQQEVNSFGKGLSRYIDTVLRERQKSRKSTTAVTNSGGGGAASAGGGAASAGGGVEVGGDMHNVLPAAESYRGSHAPVFGEDGGDGWQDGRDAKRVRVHDAHDGGGVLDNTAGNAVEQEVKAPQTTTPPPPSAEVHAAAVAISTLHVPTPVRVAPTGMSFAPRDAALAALPEDAPHRGATAAT